MEMQSLRLSAAVAKMAVESMYLPRRVLNRDSHSFAPMESTSTATMGMDTATAVGFMILPMEVLASSKPMTTIITATAKPDRYSNRAWP